MPDYEKAEEAIAECSSDGKWEFQANFDCVNETEAGLVITI